MAKNNQLLRWLAWGFTLLTAVIVVAGVIYVTVDDLEEAQADIVVLEEKVEKLPLIEQKVDRIQESVDKISKKLNIVD